MKIIFNANTELQTGGRISKADKIEYLPLYEQLTSRNPSLDYSTITATILSIIRKEVVKAITELKPEDSRNRKEDMMRDIDIIFSTIDPTDTNFIGKVNIVSLQCIILFTENAIDPATVFKINQNDYHLYYTNLRVDNWKDYSTIRKTLTTKSVGSFKYLYIQDDYLNTPYTASVPENILIYMIVVIDYLTLDEIVISFINNVIYCGLTSKFEYADGKLLAPFEFLGHDITHGRNYDSLCYQRIVISRKNLKEFYTFCKTSGLEPSIQNSAIFMIFLLVHESLCDFFRSSVMHPDEIYESITNMGFLQFDRYLNPNDLALSLPKPVRGDKDKTEKYLKDSIAIYIDLLTKFNTKKSENAGGASALGGYRRIKTIKKHRHIRKYRRKKYKSHTVKNRTKPLLRREHK